MSDHDSSEEQSPLGNALGTILMLAIPIALIAMLAVTGVAFVGGMKGKEAEAASAGGGPPSAGGPASPAGVPAAAASVGGGAEAVPEGIDPAQWAVGKKAYATCAACHGADGKGLQAGPALMAPSLIGSETLLGDPDQPILVVLKGIQKETFDYMGVMAALGALPDDQIAGVLTYLRNNWGNKAPAISTEQVAAARAKFSDVAAPAGVRRADIGSILEAHK